MVSSINIRAGGVINGFSLKFSRLNGSAISLSDAYESPWIGSPLGGTLVAVSADGGLPIGIAGRKEESGRIGTLGLLVLPTSTTTATIIHGATAIIPTTAPSVADRVTTPAAPPARGKPLESMAQMLEVLPPELQPSGGNWMVGRTVSPTLTERLRGKPARISGDFGSFKNGSFAGKQRVEVIADCGIVEYRGFRFAGKVIAKFPTEQADTIKNLQIHDHITISGNIESMIVRGINIDTIFLNLNDSQLEK